MPRQNSSAGDALQTLLKQSAPNSGNDDCKIIQLARKQAVGLRSGRERVRWFNNDPPRQQALAEIYAAFEKKAR